MKKTFLLESESKNLTRNSNSSSKNYESYQFAYVVYVCVCVCVCVCVYFLPLWGLLLTEQNNKCNARDQVSDVVLRKLLCVKYLRHHVIDNQSRDLPASNCARASIRRAEPREVKDNSLNFFERPTVKARSIDTFLLTNLGSCPAAAKKRTVTTPRGVL